MKSYTKSLIVLAALVATAAATSYWHNGPDGRRYFIETDKKYNWFQAVHQCEKLNMQLIEIQTAEKNDLLLTILHSIFSKAPSFWLGANDEYNESRDWKRPFFWSTSGKRMTYTNWSKGNPNNKKRNEHCVATSDSKYKWDDVKCTSKYGFICEDNYLSVEKCQDLQPKRKQALGISSNVTVINQQCLKEQSQILDNGLKSLQQTEKEFADKLLKDQTKFLTDVEQLVVKTRKVTMAAVDDRNKTIQRQIDDIKIAAAKVTQKFSDKIKTSHKNFDTLINC